MRICHAAAFFCADKLNCHVRISCGLWISTGGQLTYSRRCYGAVHRRCRAIWVGGTKRALLYIKKFNEQGILNGKVIEAIAEDEEGDSTEAILVYNKLIDEGVTAIIGDVTSTSTIALAQKSVLDTIPCVTASQQRRCGCSWE